MGASVDTFFRVARKRAVQRDREVVVASLANDIAEDEVVLVLAKPFRQNVLYVEGVARFAILAIEA
jgi:hypothetical protein